jgi:Acetoacetate decarboxylase (ADC)
MGGSPPDTWITDAKGVGYPPEPWHLRGVLHASVWLVPLADMPASLPQGAKPILLNGRALLLTVWAVYMPGGVLAYNEMMCAMAVRTGLRVAATITHIWVDSPSSAAGGQALWGIPKHLGTFKTEAGARFEASVSDRKGPVAAFLFTSRLALPGRWRIAGRTAQTLEGRLKLTAFQAAGRVQFGRSAWRFDESGPLRFLRAHRPLLNLRFDRMAISFGSGAIID